MTDKNSDGVSLYDIVILALRRWWVGAICVTLAVSVALWVAFTSEAVYRAEAVLALAQSSDQSTGGLTEQLGGLAALAGVSLQGATDRKAEGLATLQSRRLVESFVQERNLLPVLFASRWDSSRNAWKPNVEVPTLWDAYELIADDVIKVVEDRKTGLITLGVEWTDPKVAAQWNREFVERTNSLLQESAYERATRNIAFLKRQLQETDIVGVRQALNNLMESELKTSMLAQRSEDYAFKVLDPAVVPERRVRPRRTLLLALGITVGLFMWAIGLVFSQIVSGLLEEHRRRGSATAR
jgi:uncharacterized protein involved in exopolysaccharide biosynthesis